MPGGVAAYGRAAHRLGGTKMTENNNSGMCWHGWHNKLGSFVPDIAARIKEIQDIKPANEVPTRLRLLKKVQGKLPAEVIKAAKAWAESREASVWAWIEAEEAEVEATARHLPAIEALHAKECPACPWNGKEIVFPKEVKK